MALRGNLTVDRMARIYILLLSVLIAACGATPVKEQNPAAKVQESRPAIVEPAVIVPIFDADSAYAFVDAQIAFGPRVPNTSSHRKCGEYLVDKLRGYGAEVVTQDVKLKAYNGDMLDARNIIAQFQPQKSDRILLCAHWDSRPWADSDPDKANHYKPVPGANDGGSGVGILLEIARQLSQVPTALGVDIILFDAEDYGLHEKDMDKYYSNRHSWALGSQYWASNPHRKGYAARYGILLDIVGAPGSRFLHEGYSMHFASDVVAKVWDLAGKLGYTDYFIQEEGGTITDDHYYVSSISGIPCIDIINCDMDSPNGFGIHHHTVKDDMDWIDANTLKAVGHTVMTVIYNEK